VSFWTTLTLLALRAAGDAAQTAQLQQEWEKLLPTLENMQV